MVRAETLLDPRRQIVRSAPGFQDFENVIVVCLVYLTIYIIKFVHLIEISRLINCLSQSGLEQSSPMH